MGQSTSAFSSKGANVGANSRSGNDAEELFYSPPQSPVEEDDSSAFEDCVWDCKWDLKLGGGRVFKYFRTGWRDC